MQEQISISGALSNLGVLAKAQGLHAYREMRNKVGSQSKSQAREQLNGHLHKAVAYFEQHLEIVEELADL